MTAVMILMILMVIMMIMIVMITREIVIVIVIVIEQVGCDIHTHAHAQDSLQKINVYKFMIVTKVIVTVCIIHK